MFDQLVVQRFFFVWEESHAPVGFIYEHWLFLEKVNVIIFRVVRINVAWGLRPFWFKFVLENVDVVGVYFS